MLGNLMGKMQEEQQKVKEQLDQLIIENEFQNGLIKIKITGNKKVKDVSISEDLLKESDTEMLGDMLTEAINEAIESADKRSQEEMHKILKDVLPNIPGLGM